MNKLIKYIKFIPLLFLISLYGCNDFQNNSFNIVFGSDIYSFGKNRIIFSAIENVETNINNDFRVEITNVDSNTNSESFVIKPNFYTWPNKNTGFYAFDYVFESHGEYKINVYEFKNPEKNQIQTILVKENQTPVVGESIPLLDNKIISNKLDISEITSDPEPEINFYTYKFSEALNLNRPIIVFFLSPNFCKTATCFPQLEVLKRLQNQYDDKIIFIHVEVYENPHLIRGDLKNAQVSNVLDDWNINSEPYTFLINQKKLVSKFQGYVSYDEILIDIKNIINVD